MEKERGVIIAAIEHKEAQLARARMEMEGLTSGKYKNSSNAQMSKMLVASFEAELAKLRDRLKTL